ncbi:MAG: DUF87 domain-containing protein [Nitrososphaeria archaeon]|nr:DUF87 domain-containing protein [Nitrososphaeria archaeon]MDW7986355.1 DUF87 domain-containing protein [Nitrososphaerota archaeon]
MKILSKNNDTIELLASPDEELLERGDYLVIEDNGRKLLVQVIDIEYADLPGILEDTLRELSSEDVKKISMIDPYSVGSLLAKLREARLIIAKFRGVLINGELRNDVLWLPSRLNSRIYKASPSLIVELSKSCGRRVILMGEFMGDWFTINAESLDGRLTIITGKKEMGKSHLAKLLVTSLVEYGARVVVFDINGEYKGLSLKIDGSESELCERLMVLVPGENFKVSIEEASLKTLLDILRYVYDTPSSSLREFSRIWYLVERTYKKVTLKGLIEAVSKTQMNESIREALLSRLLSLESLEFFDDGEPVSLEELFRDLEYGGALIIDLSRSLPHGRRVVVEYVLSRLSSMLKNSLPVFLLAEEAHLYLRDTYWDDLVTRMRHIGIFPIFVTNQPDMIPDSVYRQADNIFLFNFTNDSDLDYLAKASRVDAETVKRIVKALPQRKCLVIGRVVNDLPIVVKVRELMLKTMGETKLFFTSIREQ